MSWQEAALCKEEGEWGRAGGVAGVGVSLASGFGGMEEVCEQRLNEDKACVWEQRLQAERTVAWDGDGEQDWCPSHPARRPTTTTLPPVEQECREGTEVRLEKSMPASQYAFRISEN